MRFVKENLAPLRPGSKDVIKWTMTKKVHQKFFLKIELTFFQLRKNICIQQFQILVRILAPPFLKIWIR